MFKHPLHPILGEDAKLRPTLPPDSPRLHRIPRVWQSALLDTLELIAVVTATAFFVALVILCTWIITR